MAISDTYKRNWETLQRAIQDGNAALVECQRVSDGATVVMICAISVEGKGKQKVYNMIPFAEMVSGNPYELYRPPNPMGGFHPAADTHA